MQLVGNYTASYYQAAGACHCQEQLAKAPRPTKQTVSADELACMNRELAAHQQELSDRVESYGDNFLNLVVVSGYLFRLLTNEQIVRFLSQRHLDFLLDFQQIVAATSLRSSGCVPMHGAGAEKENLLRHHLPKFLQLAMKSSANAINCCSSALSSPVLVVAKRYQVI
jgi:hypothetical protein